MISNPNKFIQFEEFKMMDGQTYVLIDDGSSGIFANIARSLFYINVNIARNKQEIEILYNE